MLIQSHLVTNEEPIFTGAMSAYPFSETLKAKLTFKTAFDETVCMGVTQGNTILVPRRLAPVSKKDFRTWKEPNAINCNFVPRFPEQGLTVDRCLDLLKQGIDHVVQAPTGYGKTIVGSVVACRLGQPTMFIAPKDDLLQQWHTALTKVLKVPAALVGHVQQDNCEWQGKQFVVGSAQSLIIPDRYPEEMYRYFGLVVWDEVHQMATECFIRTCQMFSAYHRLGFSATPDRRDGKTRILTAHIGPVMVKGTIVPMKPKVLVKNTGWRIPEVKKKVENAWVYEKIPHAPGRMMLVTKAMAASQTRNAEIVGFTKQAFASGRNILIMSDLIDGHLKKMFHLLTTAGIPGNEIGFYCGGVKKSELELAKTRRVVLATYAMCSTGTDVPHWDTLVMATPRANIKQAMGRILRSMDGKRTPIILELVDAESIFQNFHISRLKQYYSVGAEIVKM